MEHKGMLERDQTNRRHSIARNFPPCRRLATRTKLAENRALQISGMGPDQASAPRTLQVGGTVGAEPRDPPCLGRGQRRVALVELW